MVIAAAIAERISNEPMHVCVNKMKKSSIGILLLAVLAIAMVMQISATKTTTGNGAPARAKGLWPVEGAKILGWYITSDVPHMGITLEEAETVEQVMKGALVWENAKPGIFKVLKVSPAMTAEDAIPLVMEM